MIVVNDSITVAEISALTNAYEEALVANDTEALKAYFWQSEDALRFGVTEELYGMSAIEKFRDERKVSFKDRKILKKTVLALGTSTAVSTLEFSVSVRGQKKHGRQTQVWAVIEDEWKIVSAHVSHKVMPNSLSILDYVDVVSWALDLPIDPDCRASVAKDLNVMRTVAAPLMALNLDDTDEPAPVFQP